MKMKNIVSIAGNIGSGKSTLLKRLNSAGMEVKEESVDEWTILPRFYENMTRWSFALQVQILLSIITKELPGIIERSPWESLKIFSQLAKDQNLFDPEEYSLLEQLHEQLAWNPETVIYLRLDPAICCKRIKQRGRDCENDISEKYVNDLHYYYEKETELLPNCIIIDASKSADEVFQDVLSKLKKE
jgi:deoxyadenosine/deoxycytidine kinase